VIGSPTNKAGTPLSSILLLKVDRILVMVEGFLLKDLILILVKRTLLILKHGFGFIVDF